jgi:outer membrane lipopolysaccharide assembly protein LptE/RlpB
MTSRLFQRHLAGFVAAIILPLAGCGYHTTAHSPKQLPSLQTIAVPAFVNQTQTYKIEQTLTAAVVQELVSRTNYKIENSSDSSADAILRGTVVSTQIAPLTYDAQSGRVSSAIVTLALRVTLVDRTGRVLYENSNYNFHEQYELASDLNSFFQEASPALNRVAHDFARMLVSDIVEGY